MMTSMGRRSVVSAHFVHAQCLVRRTVRMRPQHSPYSAPCSPSFRPRDSKLKHDPIRLRTNTMPVLLTDQTAAVYTAIETGSW